MTIVVATAEFPVREKEPVAVAPLESVAVTV
jgi:hypothetical protein